MTKSTSWFPLRLLVLCITATVFSVAGCTQPPLPGQASQHQTQGLLYCAFDVSPDGKTIVFSGTGNGGKDLYLLNLTTYAVTRLTNTPEYENFPVFSPNGKTIVYQSAKDLSSDRHLFLRSLDGRYIRQLTNTPQTSDDNPHFSPNGERIVFTRSKRFHLEDSGEDTWSNSNVYVVNPDGSHIFQVTNLNNDGMMRPKFYPDSRHILFERTVVPDSPWSLSGVEMYLVKADSDGKEPIQDVIRFSGSDFAPSFYPDGKQIVFGGNFNGILDLYRVSLTGGKPFKILTRRINTGFCNALVTSDGKSIYCMERYNPDIYKMNADGSGLRQIADSSLFSDPMHWKP